MPVSLLDWSRAVEASANRVACSPLYSDACQALNADATTAADSSTAERKSTKLPSVIGRREKISSSRSWSLRSSRGEEGSSGIGLSHSARCAIDDHVNGGEVEELQGNYDNDQAERY